MTRVEAEAKNAIQSRKTEENTGYLCSAHRHRKGPQARQTPWTEHGSGLSGKSTRVCSYPTTMLAKQASNAMPSPSELQGYPAHVFAWTPSIPKGSSAKLCRYYMKAQSEMHGYVLGVILPGYIARVCMEPESMISGTYVYISVRTSLYVASVQGTTEKLVMHNPARLNVIRPKPSALCSATTYATLASVPEGPTLAEKASICLQDCLNSQAWVCSYDTKLQCRFAGSSGVFKPQCQPSVSAQPQKLSNHTHRVYAYTAAFPGMAPSMHGMQSKTRLKFIAKRHDRAPHDILCAGPGSAC